MGYDALLLVAIWMIATLPIVIVGNSGITTGHPVYRVYLALLAFAYFHISWSRIGQTAGMRAWRIHLVNAEVGHFSAVRSALRMIAAAAGLLAFGIGYFWALTRTDRAAWPDLASRSRLVWRRPQRP